MAPTRGASWSRVAGSSPTKIAPVRSMVTLIGSLTSSTAPASVLGSSTGTPTVSKGAEIMKMISSTSMTSTSGVTLISDSGRFFARLRPRTRPPPAPPAPMPISAPPRVDGRLGHRGAVAQTAGHRGLQLVGEALEPAGELGRVDRELVVGDIGRDGRRQADGGGEQGLGDGRRHRGQVGVAGRGDGVEGVHDAPDGAEQADEGRRRGDHR